jgi:alpha-galactosidase
VKYLLACLLGVLSLHCVDPIPEPAPHPDEPVGTRRQALARASYLLVRAGSGKCLDVAGGTADGMKLVQWSCHGGANQQFRVEPLGWGLLRLVDQSSGKCVDVERSGTADGTSLQIWPCNGTAAQTFALEDAGGGYQRLRNPHSGKCVDVHRASHADGARVQLWTCNDSGAQSFRMSAQAGFGGDPGDALEVSEWQSRLTLSSGNVRVEYDLATGTADFVYGGIRRIAGFYAGVQLERYVTSRDYSERTFTVEGDQVIVTSRGHGLPVMEQLFKLMGGHRFLTRVMVHGRDLSTDWIAPLVVSSRGGVDLGSHADPRLLWVPFDNDAWVSYNAGRLDTSGVSFEAAAFYDNASRHGLVVGSVLHDTWKTGIYYDGSSGRLDALNVFGGVTDPTWTHDVVPHGKVRGDVLYSPLVFVGYGPDWRDLLEEYSDVNAFYEGKLRWEGGVPFGWNSWGKLQDKLSHGTAIAASDFLAELAREGFHNQGTTYVNLDSYWDNLSEAELRDFVAHAHARGQRAGIYWTPFVDWGKWDRQVEGSAYRYEQLWLRDARGNPIELDGAYALDPTHPGTKQRIDHYIERLASLGFTYIKLDFLTHGALESTVRHDPGVRTGIQAYNQGMRYLRDRIAGRMFISESIAPIFPHQYAHARRVACDTYGAARGFASSEYGLNATSYGFWQSGRLYQYNDPDHMVFEGFSEAENRTRFLSGVVGGTVLLNGDDLSREPGRSLARRVMTNPRWNEVARLGRVFRPVEGNTGTGPSELLTLQQDTSTYVAVFNFSGRGVTHTLDHARLGLHGSRHYRITDLGSGEVWSSAARSQVGVGKDDARLLRFE